MKLKGITLLAPYIDSFRIAPSAEHSHDVITVVINQLQPRRIGIDSAVARTSLGDNRS